MGGCSAVNCSNHSRNKFRMFRFPTDEARRRKWTINCRRDGWVPGPYAELCSVHFEESQYEQHRADNVKKLKPNAVPTLFDVPNPPATFASKRIKGRGLPKPGSLLDKTSVDDEEVSKQDLLAKIRALEEENKKLKSIIDHQNKSLSFLSPEQIKASSSDNSSLTHWSNESIIKGLKLRFALGKFGYTFLRSTGYPAPAYSTLNRRIRGISINFGVLHELLYLLKTKVECMDATEKLCAIFIDEMEIACNQDFDTSTKSFVGNITLGSKKEIGNHYTVVLLRGLKSPWKQVIAHEITGPSCTGVKMKELMCATVEAVRDVGLKVMATVSDMGSNNKALWKSLGVCVSRDTKKTSYTIGDSSDVIHSVADVPHLLKNMRSALLSRVLILPEEICKKESLPSKHISSGYIKQLWITEINSDSSLRSLHHLNKEHLFPTHFSLMNVAKAVQLFSLKTAAALEKAVHLRQISKEALTTAWFIRLINEWFSLMSARHVKKGITVKNKETKFQFLQTFIYVLQNMQLGKGWKPLQTGMIMSSMSVISIAQEMFLEGCRFFLPGRLSQDALENVFSQIRRKSSSKPTALQARRALKLICVSQFISDLKNTNYYTDSDCHLLDFAKENEPVHAAPTVSGMPTCPSAPRPLTSAADENDIYYMASATVYGVLKKTLCSVCTEAIVNAEDSLEPNVPKHRTILNDYSNMGGLKNATSGIYRICREAEAKLQMYKINLLNEEISIDAEFIRSIKEKCERVVMPECCNLKEKIIEYYLIVRCKGIKKHIINKKAQKKVYSSASASKKNN